MRIYLNLFVKIAVNVVEEDDGGFEEAPDFVDEVREHLDALLAGVAAGDGLDAQVDEEGSRLGAYDVDEEALARARGARDQDRLGRRGQLVNSLEAQRQNAVFPNHLRDIKTFLVTIDLSKSVAVLNLFFYPSNNVC